jgi:spore germination protein
MMSKRIVKGIFIFILTSYLQGCVPSKVIDDLEIIHNVGFDSDGDQIKESVVSPNYTDGKKAILISAKGENPSSVKEKIGSKSQHQIEYGQIRVFVFGNELSRNGISEIIEFLCKDPTIGATRVVVSNQAAEDILKATLKAEPLYLMDLVDTSIRNQVIPDIDLHRSYDQYYGEGLDIYLPIVSLDPRGKIQINGLGIFIEDRLKLTLSEEETFIFNTINERKKGGIYDFTIRKDEKKSNIGVELLYGKDKIKFKRENNYDIAIINLRLDFELKRLPRWVDIETSSDRSNIESQLEKSISKEVMSLLEKLQDNKLDPIGLGVTLRSKDRNWNEKQYYEEIYPKMKFKVNTKVNIRSAGAGTF